MPWTQITNGTSNGSSGSIHRRYQKSSMKLSMCPHHLSHKPVDSGIVCTHRQTGPECPQASSCQMYDTQTVIYVCLPGDHMHLFISSERRPKGGKGRGGRREREGQEHTPAQDAHKHTQIHRMLHGRINVSHVQCVQCMWSCPPLPICAHNLHILHIVRNCDVARQCLSVAVVCRR